MSLNKGRNETPVTQYPPDTIGDGSKTVTAAGTAETLVAVSTGCRKVLITAKSTNTGNVFVGGSTVSSSRGKPLVPLQDVWIEIDDLIKIYVDVAVNGEGVSFVYYY